MSKISGFTKQATVLCTLALSLSASAQWGGGGGQSNRCDEDRNQYQSENRCERITGERCIQRGNCFVPDRGGRDDGNRCNERRNEFDSEGDCLRKHEYCEYNRQSQCYEPSTPKSRCNEKYNEYERESECIRDHQQGCGYRSDIKCYVPNEKPTPTPPPPPPPAPPVCPWNDDDGSYEGRGRRGFRNQEVCEISEGRRSGACEQRGDGCWHPRGR